MGDDDDADAVVMMTVMRSHAKMERTTTVIAELLSLLYWWKEDRSCQTIIVVVLLLLCVCGTGNRVRVVACLPNWGLLLAENTGRWPIFNHDVVPVLGHSRWALLDIHSGTLVICWV